MKIGVDASRYKSGEATGVEYYSKYIIDGLIKELGKKDELLLYSRERLALKGDRVFNIVIEQRRLWTLIGLSAEMRKREVEVLFVPSHVLPLKRPERSVITIHDTAFKYLRSAYSFFQYHYLNWSTKYAVKHADTIIVPSEATASDLKHFFNCPSEKVVVIPHGFSKENTSINKELFKKSDLFKYFGINEKTNYFFFVGRLEIKKNILNILRAFKKFRENHKEYYLILGGKRGTGFKEILQKAEKEDLLHNVIMPGYISSEEKNLLYKYCQAFVFPSFYEGFGLPIQEAFFHERPVLTSHLSAIPEVAGEAACYVDPNDPENIAKMMEKLILDKDYREKLVEAGKTQLEKFSWKKCAERTLAVIRNKHGQ